MLVVYFIFYARIHTWELFHDDDVLPGPMYEFYNSVLRAKGDTIPWGDDYPMLRGERVTGRFVTTIHAVSPTHPSLIIICFFVFLYFVSCDTVKKQGFVE